MPVIKNRIPGKGSVENMMQRLQSYIEPVDPEWSKRLKPASENNIEKWRKKLHLEEKNLDFPLSYLTFLRYAGEGDGGLFEKTLRAEISLELHLRYGWRIDVNEYDISHPYCFEFTATKDLNIPYTMNLGKQNDKIFCDMSDQVSSSFENLIFQCAVEIYEKLYFSSCETFLPGKEFNDFNIIEQGKKMFLVADEMAQKKQLCKAWFSDDSIYFAYSDEMSLFINSRDYGGIGMICYDKKEEVEDIRKSLISDMNAIIY